MGSSLINLDPGSIAKDIGDLAVGIREAWTGKKIVDPAVMDELALKAEAIQQALPQGQISVNKVEAASSSIFVAGWRPYIGWVGGAALTYQFILYPLLIWFWTFGQVRGWIPQHLTPPPVLPSGALYAIVTTMLGAATLRTAEKVKGVQGVH